MKQFRMNRLFHQQSGRCLDVAIDHGMAGEVDYLAGIEDLPRAIDVLVEAAPDAIQLTVGQAELLQSRPGRGKPSLVLRTDVANVYGKDLPDELWSVMIEDPVGQAVRLDAACVVVNLFDIPDQPALRRACVENLLRLKPGCEAAAMPLMVEPLVMQPSTRGGGYAVHGDSDRIVALVRQAVELGADIIKADPTDDLDDYHRVVETARVPVLVRGGGRVEDDELLRRTHALIAQGVGGLVYGRNIIQHRAPAAMVRALMALLHDDAELDQAAAILSGEQ